MTTTDSDTDEWDREDFPDLTIATKPLPDTFILSEENSNDDWNVSVPTTIEKVSKQTNHPTTGGNSSSSKNVANNGFNNDPLILVDMTELSNGAIHSKYDPNSVNDPQAVAQLRRTIEREYESFAHNLEHLRNGIVIPCGSSVWKDALVTLRKEKVGHYWIPIFPPLAKK